MQKGRIAQSLVTDNEVTEAVKVLRDPQRYQQLLH